MEQRACACAPASSLFRDPDQLLASESRAATLAPHELCRDSSNGQPHAEHVGGALHVLGCNAPFLTGYQPGTPATSPVENRLHELHGRWAPGSYWKKIVIYCYENR